MTVFVIIFGLRSPGIENPFIITGRMNCGKSLGGRKN